MLKKLTYPSTRTVDVVDDFFGTKVSDPYRWLEDAADPEVQAWTQEQSDLAFEILGTMPGRDVFRERLTEHLDYPKYMPPVKKNGRLFYTYNDGLKNQAALYVQESDGTPRVLLDPNDWSEDGTIALVDFRPTEDGTTLAYAISESGLDWRTFKFIDVKSGAHLPDIIKNVKFSMPEWLPDGSGFYYSRFPDDMPDIGSDNQKIHQQLYFHKMGTSQADDELIYERPDVANSSISAVVSDDGQYLVVHLWRTAAAAENLVYFREIGKNGDFVPLFDKNDASYVWIGNDEDTAYILTTKEAPRRQVIAIDLRDPDTPWQTIVAESEDVITSCTIVNDQFVIVYMSDVHHIITRYSKAGHILGEVDLPGLGALNFMRPEVLGNTKDTEMFFSFETFLTPPRILRYDFEQDRVEAYFDTFMTSFDANKYETRQVFFQSKDGTRVPMFISSRKGLPLNCDNPTILLGYGGYDVSLVPEYKAWIPAWLEQGGIFAVANLRGGGEYGDEWHRAGMLDKKQNVFDDFIAAAEWLIDQKYTSSSKLAIRGGSNGGLLVVAVMLQRPELFGAVLCHVPVTDMLRFQHFSAGRYWTGEYGDARASKDQFEFLYAYSPLHNIKPGQTYPPLLILTADHDDRVVPMHSKKFAAALQAADEGNNAILLRIDTKAGHGMGKPTAKIIEDQVDSLAFLAGVFEMEVR